MVENAIKDLTTLFDEAKQKSEFDFVLALINYKGMGTPKLTTNLYEWFDAMEFYTKLYNTHTYKEKTRIGTLIYSTFFENSDFYNIIGSLCKIKLGYKGSSYLFWKTKKYERLLGIGQKQDFLIELLEDSGKQNIITFFVNNHFKEIRNCFFHSAYSLSDTDFILHDSDPIIIENVGYSELNVESFLYPKIENILLFFDSFKKLYLNSFDSYKEEKEVIGFFPNEVKVTILGSIDGLQGFKIKNSIQLYGKFHDSGIWYEKEDDMWAGYNINMYFTNIETIEIRDQLTRYENKIDIQRSDTEFYNIVEKIIDRNDNNEIVRAINLLMKFGNIRYEKMKSEQNLDKKKSFSKIILPFYRKAVEIGTARFDMSETEKVINGLK